MGLNPKVWLSHLFFVLETMAIQYPANPNSVAKKKYYDFIQNIPVFFPDKPMGENMLKILDKYPVTPYLSSRMSFMKWVHFIKTHIKRQMKEPIDNFYEHLEKYYENYKPQEIVNQENSKRKFRYVHFGLLVSILLGIFYIYKK